MSTFTLTCCWVGWVIVMGAVAQPLKEIATAAVPSPGSAGQSYAGRLHVTRNSQRSWLGVTHLFSEEALQCCNAFFFLSSAYQCLHSMRRRELRLPRAAPPATPSPEYTACFLQLSE